ncbi:MAG: HGGxSTG domain-containing protein [Chlamydiota bacterium]|jgi:hypothetical protein
MGKCSAKSKRSGEQCKNWAIRGKTKCKFHGGKSIGPRTAIGKEKARQAHVTHGLKTQQNLQQVKQIRQLIEKSKNFLKSF